MKALIVLMLTALILTGCSSAPREEVPQTTIDIEEIRASEETIFIDPVVLDIQELEVFAVPVYS